MSLYVFFIYINLMEFDSGPNTSKILTELYSQLHRRKQNDAKKKFPHSHCIPM